MLINLLPNVLKFTYNGYMTVTVRKSSANDSLAENGRGSGAVSIVDAGIVVAGQQARFIRFYDLDRMQFGSRSNEVWHFQMHN